MKRFPIKIFLLLLTVAASFSSAGQFYQGSYNEFGKNRVQYRDFLWQQYRFEKFDTYFYEGGQQLAEFTSKVAEKNIQSIEDIFDYTMSDKVQFIVYNTQSDFKQSNIGITGDDAQNIGGTATIVGAKVFVFFDGDLKSFERQIREGISRVLINQILYGGGWRDVIKTSTLLALPEWFIEGLILYASKNADHQADSRIKSGVLTGQYEKFNRLEGREAHLAGYALWEYVAMVYGENILPNILYMSRVSRNVESGFLFVLGKSLETIIAEFLAYYRGEYAVADMVKEDINLEPIPIKTRKDRRVTAFEISPDGNHAVYVTNIMGQYRVYHYDISREKRNKILKAEHKLERIPDYSFPVFAWHPTSEAVTFITEWRGKLMLNTYNLDEGKTVKREIFQLDKVLSMNYSPSGQQLIFSGVDKGQTDLYLYYLIGNRQERLTNDVYGEFEPSFSKDGSRVIFSSNRPDDTLRTKETVTRIPSNRDVFAFNLKTRSPYLERITDTPGLTEHHPYQYDDRRYTFTADYEGVINRYVATYDSVISRIDTTVHYRYFTTAKALSNFRDDMLNYSANPATGSFGTMFFREGKYEFYKGNFRNDGEGTAAVTDAESEEEEEDQPTEDDLSAEEAELVAPIRLPPKSREGREVDTRNYTFEGEKKFEYQQETVTITEIPRKQQDYRPGRDGITLLDSISLPGARNYNLNFAVDDVIAQMDNTYGVDFYQPISSANNLNPGLSGLFRVGASDLFEDYKLTGGFRLAGNFDNNVYVVSLEDLSKRIDKRFTGIRVSNRFQAGNQVVKVITYQGAYRMSYPVNEVFSLRGTGILRHDRYINLAVEQSSLRAPNVDFYYAGLKGEAVFDNTRGLGLNLYQGMRAKVWAEYYRDPTNWDTDFVVVGGDFRHYTKIHRSLIWANRFAWSSSVGSERLLHYLGGVDNWLFPRNDNSIPVDMSQNFAFQTIGAPMRGFIYNARNGNSFAVVNSEIRLPFFKYLFDRPLKSDFLENFQIVAFGDAGSAWTGPSPFSPENAFNNTVIRRGDLTIEVENNRNPIVFGYGFGLRSRLLGYFVRVDWAWGIDDGTTLPSVFYLSLALDF